MMKPCVLVRRLTNLRRDECLGEIIFYPSNSLLRNRLHLFRVTGVPSGCRNRTIDPKDLKWTVNRRVP